MHWETVQRKGVSWQRSGLAAGSPTDVVWRLLVIYLPCSSSHLQLLDAVPRMLLVPKLTCVGLYQVSVTCALENTV